MNCKNCNNEINPKNKFCNRSCAATFNNKNRIQSEETKKKKSDALKGKIHIHPLTDEILKDYSDGMLMKDICTKYHIGQRRLRVMLKTYDAYTEPKSNKNKFCNIHNIEYSPTARGQFKCKKCSVEQVTKRKQELKIKAVEYKGGKCEKCGYNKSMSALEFHHVDPNIKEKNIARYSTRQWEHVKKELDKCILVCANCHREIHENLKKSG